jgi:flavorubredoxin
MAEVFKSRAILVGSSTINRGMLSSVAAFWKRCGAGVQKKEGDGLRCVWMEWRSRQADFPETGRGGFCGFNDGLRLLWNPDDGGIEECVRVGKSFVNN